MKKLNYLLHITVLVFFISLAYSTQLSAAEINRANKVHKMYPKRSGGPNLLQITLNKNIYGYGFTNVDGSVVVFDSSFSKALGPEDSKKFGNGGENIAIYDNGTQLSIDGLPNPVGGDSIFIEMWQVLNDSSYKILIDATQFNILASGVRGYIRDKYLGTITPLRADSNVIAFSPKTSNTATYLLRYVIYFYAAPVHITNLNGCNQYTYKGITYTSSTTLRDTIRTVQAGFDSIYNVTNISVNPIVASTNSIPLSSCNSIVYKGVTYTNSTTVRDTVKSIQGCDSIYNVANIVITSIVATTNNIPLAACNSIVYKGITYSNSTTVRDTVKSVQGCDSIYNVANIVITPIVASTNNIPLAACNSIIYKGNAYYNSTTVRDTVKSVQGCDSIYNVANIVITPIVAITNNIPLDACNSIVYKGITYSNSTTVRDTLKSIQGCDSIYDVANIVITPIIASTNIIPLAACNSLVYKGITYNTTTTVRDTVISVQGCDSIYNVADIVITPIVATTNNIPFAACNSIVYKGITYTNSTIIRDTVISVQGCDSIYNVTSIIIAPIVPVTKTQNHTGCGSFVYNGITYNNSTTVSDTVKSFQGCDSIYNVANITISTPVTPTVTVGSSSIVANGNSVTFTATAINGGIAPTYTFIVNSIVVQSGTSNTYSSSTLHIGDSVSCSIISHATCVTDSIAKSNTIIMVTNVPLTLVGFQAVLNGSITNCTWQTTAEINTAYFILQRSINGTEFSTLNTIKATGNLTEESKYSSPDAIDKDLKNLTAIYYRLQIVDKDGQFVYSNVVKVNLSTKRDWNIYPNPAKDILNISSQNICSIQITGIDGRILLIRNNLNNDVTKLDISKLIKGIYLINILSNSGDRQVKKLIVE